MTESDVIKVWISFLSNIICCGLVFALLCFHIVWFYQDFWTKDRKSVSHCRRAPSIDNYYKLIHFITLLCMILAVFACFGFAIYCYELIDYSLFGGCSWVAIISAWPVHLSKLCLYYVFILRLQSVFSRSAYAYAVWKLKLLAVIVTIVTIVIMTLEILVNVTKTFESELIIKDYSGDGTVRGCNESRMPVSATSYAIFDFSMNITWFYLFYRPLKLVIMKADNNGKLLYFAMKVSILTWVACGSSVISVIIYGGSGLILVGIDFLTHCLCLALMTAYYRDDIWFLTLCKLCVFCCDKKQLVKTQAHLVYIKSRQSMKNGLAKANHKMQKSGSNNDNFENDSSNGKTNSMNGSQNDSSNNDNNNKKKGKGNGKYHATQESASGTNLPSDTNTKLTRVGHSSAHLTATSLEIDQSARLSSVRQSSLRQDSHTNTNISDNDTDNHSDNHSDIDTSANDTSRNNKLNNNNNNNRIGTAIVAVGSSSQHNVEIEKEDNDENDIELDNIDTQKQLMKLHLGTT